MLSKILMLFKIFAWQGWVYELPALWINGGKTHLNQFKRNTGKRRLVFVKTSSSNICV